MVLFIEDGVSGVWAAGFHVMGPRLNVVIRLQAGASGIHDLRRAMPDNTRNMGVPAKDERSGVGSCTFA
jgi:hypothetical protein